MCEHPEKRKAGIKITSAMLKAGVAAYEEWERFEGDPLEGKSRSWLTKRERSRLHEEAMVLEVLEAIFGKVDLSQTEAPEDPC